MIDSATSTYQNKNTLTGSCISDQVSHPAIPGKVCNLDYLNRITRGDQKSAAILIEIFFEEITYALKKLYYAIDKTNFSAISNIAHNMKSAFAILGVAFLEPIINEMEHLSIQSNSIEKIRQLCETIDIVFNQAKLEMNMIN